MRRAISPRLLSPVLEAFFTDRLMQQRRASAHTIASYRDTFRLLLKFLHEHWGKSPSELELNDISAPRICAFLDGLEKNRGLSARSRNQRLAAIRSFFRYAAFEAPERSALIQRVLAIPSKRHDRALIAHLTQPEVESLLAAPNRTAWLGRRDHALLLLAIQTGLRVSELTSLKNEDVVLGTGAHVRCQGKGRKERCTPLTKTTVAVLQVWLKERQAEPAAPLFPGIQGDRLSSDAVQHLLARHVETASKRCPTLQKKTVSPHVLRHTTAMQLLQAGVDRSVIALWLGHESPDTTQIYFDANLAIKEEVLKKTAPLRTRPGRYRAGDQLLAFLANL